MNKKIRNIIVFVLLAIGIVLLTVGIVLLIRSSKIEVPKLGEPGWFDTESKKSAKIFGGIFTMVTGFAFLSSSLFVFIAGHGVRRVSENLKSFKFEDKSQKKFQTCPYCNTKNKIENTECENCGASLSGKE